MLTTSNFFKTYLKASKPSNSQIQKRTLHVSSTHRQNLSGAFKEREQALENYKVREHEEKVIQQLKDEIKVSDISIR